MKNNLSALLFIAPIISLLIHASECQPENTPITLPPLDEQASIDSLLLEDLGSGQANNSSSVFAPINNSTAAAAAKNLTYGLAPEFNSTTGGAKKRLTYTGQATSAYSVDPISFDGGLNLGCGFGYVGEAFRGAYVGVSPSFFNRGYTCGRCILLQCDDASCQVVGTQVAAQILDQCGECNSADMNIANPLFVHLSGRQPSMNPSLAVSWQFIDCSPYINSTIKMLVKPGGTAYYQAFNFANSRQVITAVQVNGQRLKYETNQWAWSPTGGAIDPRGPFDFALLGANKQILQVRLPQLRSADLGIQFSDPSNTTIPATEDNGPTATAVDTVPVTNKPIASPSKQR